MTNVSNDSATTELCGTLHLHTTCSDGGADYPTLIQAAKDVGLDFVVVTDHMTLKGRELGYEGFSNNLLVVVGYEHNDSNNINHYLALGTSKVARVHNAPQDYINAIKEDGGVGFLAHPVEKRNYFKSYPPYPWTAWDAVGFDGIELWNQMSEWLEHLTHWAQFFHLAYPRRFLRNAPEDCLVIWDKCNRLRFVSGIGGVDAHTMLIRMGLFRWTIFPIKVELKGVRTHVFLNEPLPRNDAAASQRIFINALKDGRCFVSNYRRGDARGTRIFLEYANGVCSLPGIQPDNMPLPAVLKVSLPEPADIRLIANGKEIARNYGLQTHFNIPATGLYRIEVYKKNNAWIYSNPFPIGSYPLW